MDLLFGIHSDNRNDRHRQNTSKWTSNTAAVIVQEFRQLVGLAWSLPASILGVFKLFFTEATIEYSFNKRVYEQWCFFEKWAELVMSLIGTSLSEPHTSVTALRMHVCILVWTNHLPQMLNQRVQIFRDDGMSTPTCTSWERAWRATARLQGRRERERERRLFKLNALVARTATYFLNYGTSLTITVWQGRLRVTTGQQDVCWLQVRAWHNCSYIAGVTLIAHGLTVKLSPCPCSHSSPARRIAACLCGHSKCNLLLAQARPRIVQHLSS